MYDGKQMRLSETCGVPQSLISRHLTGKYRPDMDTLERVCAALPDESCGQLSAAHLEDEIPPSARRFVSVNTTITGKGVNSASQHALERLDSETRDALETLASEALINKDACEMLKSTARIISGNGSK
jgi:hypothetical protein